MIRQSVLLPCALRGTDLGGGMSLMVLQDLMAAGLVLVDGPGARTQIDQELAAWGQGAKTRAHALVVRLDAAHRFVDAALGPSRPTVACEECRPLLRVAAGNEPGALFYGNVCASAAPSIAVSCEKVAVESYPTSSFRRQVIDEATVRVPEGTPQQQFERQYLIPLLEYAKRVSLYDRNIGRTLLQRGAAPMVKAGYSETIDWILATYSRVKRRDIALFRVITGVDMAWGTADLEAAIAALNRFRTRLVDQYGIPFEIDVKPEVLRGPGFREMSHARYLITDQIGLGVERGFELLSRIPGPRRPTTVVKEVVLSRLTHDDAVAVETDTRRFTSYRTLGRPVD